MASEAELLAKLRHWLKTQALPISISTVIETGDGELLAAYVLAAFWAATHQTAVDRFDQMMGSVPPGHSRPAQNIILRL